MPYWKVSGEERIGNVEVSRQKLRVRLWREEGGRKRVWQEMQQGLVRPQEPGEGSSGADC